MEQRCPLRRKHRCAWINIEKLSNRPRRSDRTILRRILIRVDLCAGLCGDLCREPGYPGRSKGSRAWIYPPCLIFSDHHRNPSDHHHNLSGHRHNLSRLPPCHIQAAPRQGPCFYPPGRRGRTCLHTLPSGHPRLPHSPRLAAPRCEVKDCSLRIRHRRGCVLESGPCHAS